MPRLLPLLINLALPLIINPALAITPVATPQPDPKVAELAYFQGVWMCQLKPSSGLSTPPEATYIRRLKRELNNFWYIGQSETMQKVTKTHETMGYNTLTKKFGRTILSNDSSFANFLADGWNKNTFTWEGSTVNMSQQQKQSLWEVVLRQSDREFTSTFYRQDATQKAWQPTATQICKKGTSLFPQK
jgi:predicted GIY-YIG superfamily endonuclease